eukprot:gene16731-19886_t
MMVSSRSTITGNGSIYSRGYAKRQSGGDEDDNIKITEKVTEKFNIPRIIDLSEPSYGALKRLAHAQKSIEERELEMPPRADSRYKGTFKMMSSVIIERFPSLVPLPTAYEQEHIDARDRLNEIVSRPALRMQNLVEDLPEFKREIVTKAEGKEDEEDFEEDFDKYVAESRETDADRIDDRKSLKRALDKSLYLIVKKRDDEWQFPSTAWIKGESMKNAAERALRDTTGTAWKYWIPSQSPCGVHKVYLDNEEQDLLKSEGVKNFFYRSHYFGGEMEFNKKVVKDHLWVTKAELKEYFSEDYMEQSHKLIFDDCFYAHI